MKVRAACTLLSLLVLSCGTLATEAGDTRAERPNALAGPFRLLTKDEIGVPGAPYVLDQQFWRFRQPTVLVDEPGVVLGSTSLYAVATDTGVSGLYRFVAPDGRTFSEKPAPSAPVIAVADADAPEVVRVGDEIWLFFSAPAGIFLARSSDGVSFTVESAPVLGPGGAAWEAGKPPRAPAHVQVAPDDHRLVYEVNGRIGEARSSDGQTWDRVGGGPLLEPGDAVDGEPAFDGLEVGDPDVIRARSPEGRTVTRVYYTGRAADGSTGIGLAARFGDEGPLERATAPAFAGPRGPRAPAVVPQGSFTLLFIEQQAGTKEDWPAIAAGIAPATRRIPVD
ncbi:MAG: hypothetical protein HYZ29_30535 [Myxococcales bacterium]|nr:hypothetical protein [Myxococcales bacterium]